MIGLDIGAVTSVCDKAGEGEVCGPANVNSPVQIVISGSAGAVARAGILAREAGASKVIPLKVSAPFHCSLMRPVADKLREAFESVEWRTPRVPVMANVDAKPKTTVDGIRSALYEQTYMPVLWADEVSAMAERASLFCEFGPGNVLSGLIKRISKGVRVFSVNKTGDIANALEFFGETAQ